MAPFPQEKSVNTNKQPSSSGLHLGTEGMKVCLHSGSDIVTGKDRKHRVKGSREGRERQGFLTKPNQGLDVSICCCNSLRHTSAPQMSNNWDREGSGNPFTLHSAVRVHAWVYT